MNDTFAVDGREFRVPLWVVVNAATLRSAGLIGSLIAASHKGPPAATNVLALFTEELFGERFAEGGEIEAAELLIIPTLHELETLLGTSCWYKVQHVVFDPADADSPLAYRSTVHDAVRVWTAVRAVAGGD